MPFALAWAARTVVMIGIFWARDALRIDTSSWRGILPLGVLMMKLISPFFTRSRTLGRPSRNLEPFFTLIFAFVRAAAVTLVAMLPKPSFTNSRATGLSESLSLSFTLINTLPFFCIGVEAR